jgi:hypothetical protein
MLMAMPTELLDGLLDGLNAQSEMTELLLEELYYDGLSSKSSSASSGARGLLHGYRRAPGPARYEILPGKRPRPLEDPGLAR